MEITNYREEPTTAGNECLRAKSCVALLRRAMAGDQLVVTAEMASQKH